MSWETQAVAGRIPFLRPDSAVGALAAELIEQASVSNEEFRTARQDLLENGGDLAVAQSAKARIIAQHDAARLEVLNKVHYAVWTALDDMKDRAAQETNYEAAIEQARREQLATIETDPYNAYRFAIHKDDLKKLVEELAVLYRIEAECPVMLDSLPWTRQQPAA